MGRLYGLRLQAREVSVNLRVDAPELIGKKRVGTDMHRNLLKTVGAEILPLIYIGRPEARWMITEVSEQLVRYLLLRRVICVFELQISPPLPCELAIY